MLFLFLSSLYLISTKSRCLVYSSSVGVGVGIGVGGQFGRVRVEAGEGAKKDIVKSLPLYNEPTLPAPQYSGFLNASSSTPGTFLHYWFAQYDGGGVINGVNDDDNDDNDDNDQDDYDIKSAAADTFTTTMDIDDGDASGGGGDDGDSSGGDDDDDNVPLVLWLNGGPGSTSVIGMLTELGPLLVKGDGKGVVRNPYSWTSRAHLLIIESPAGVGYSYCVNSTSSDKDCYNTDQSTARDAREAMRDFFDTKFPSLKKNPFYIIGESYAGVYIPTLTKEILDHAPEINLKGIAVGDPCTDTESQRQAFDMVWYGHKYGMIPDDEFDVLYHKCNLRIPHPITRGIVHGQQKLSTATYFHKNGAAAPANSITVARSRLLSLTKDTKPSVSASAAAAAAADATDDDSNNVDCILAFRKFLLQTSNGFSQDWTDLWINDYALYAPSANFVEYDAMVQYVNRHDVMTALNVDDTPLARKMSKKGSDYQWPDPGWNWTYVKEYNACNEDAKPEDKSMIEFYRDIIPRLDNTIVYNGDADPCVSYEGTRTAMEKVGFDIIPGGTYRPWFYNASASTMEFLSKKPLNYGAHLSVQDAGVQYGGHVVNYEHNLSFATVHGSGHMVPEYRPRAALRMLDGVLSGKLLSPLLPTDERLCSMNDNEFEILMKKWTEGAKTLDWRE